MSEALHVQVRRRFGAFSLDIDFEAAPGVTVLFGPSGSGKSLTLSTVAGVVKPITGRIRLGDEAWFDGPSGIDVPAERRGVGWVFQEPRLFPHMTVEQNLRFGLRRAKRPHPRLGFDEVTTVLDIRPLLRRSPRDLSGGEAQRVAIGRALLSQPRLLLLDEPLSALHDERKAEIIRFLQHVRDAFAVPSLYVTHSLAETLRLADRLVVLEAGRVLAQGPLQTVLERSDLLGLSGRTDIGVVVRGAIKGQDSARSITWVRAGESDWICPASPMPPGAAVRLIVQAQDVLVALAPLGQLSAANQLPAVILSISPRANGEAVVRLDVGGREVLSLATVDAVQTLDLHPGRSVWVVVRAVSFEGERGGAL